MWGHSEKVAVCNQGGGNSQDTNPGDTWILDMQAPELRENKLLWFKPLSLWYSVTAAWVNNTKADKKRVAKKVKLQDKK